MTMKKIMKNILIFATVLFVVIMLIFAFIKLEKSSVYKKMKGWIDKLGDDDEKRHN